ncbi:DNA-methyltransferase [Peribacillus butanolivorans]
MILCDLPYGTTACKWDAVIPFDELWTQYERVIKDKGAIVLTAAQPFTSHLVVSNTKLFRYSLVWDKVNKYTGALNANKMPLRRHEDILVFYKKLPTFNKQYREGKPYKGHATNGHGSHTQYGSGPERRVIQNLTGKHNPCSVIEIPGDVKKGHGLHPTQKPVALFEYLIRTYTNENEVVLDNCLGSGTTAVAAINTGRQFIGIEREPEYVEIANKRIQEANT